ncbi:MULTISPECIES: RNA polymerase sigma factor [Bacillaceae]|uniref:RNA polymerase sigma factor n=1 Tax=Evansella alkalicola TaxID=745819 RepID=A0ABS6JZQ0_9BACI|nr:MULTISPECIES: RNA polymerase sigma factor [Bacillaceae]MBU9723865.1 RNA polymerase sigma factor [Bacillus alkalicola]
MSDKKVISAWFHQYSDDIYHYLIYRIGYQEAEDLLQEVFIRAWNNLDSYQGDANPKTWLLSIARNIAIDQFRNRKRSFWKKMIPFEGKHEMSGKDTPESALQMNEEKREIYHALRNIKVNYREVLILKGIQELSVRETAEALNWSENKVRLTYFRAKDALKKELGGGMDREA